MQRAPGIHVAETPDTPTTDSTNPVVEAPFSAAAFMMKIDTTLVAGPSSQNLTTDQQFRFLLNPYFGGYHFRVEWGDGSSNVIVCGKAAPPYITDTRHMPAGASTSVSLINLPSVTPDSPAIMHTYALPGQYVVALIPLAPTGLAGIAFNDYSGDTSTTKNTDCLKVLEIQQWGSNPWQAMDGFMQGARNMQITASDHARAITGGVANWDRAFCYCRAMTSFPGTLDFSGADDITSCWNGCVGLLSFPSTLNFRKVIRAVYSWTTCLGLTSFPLIELPVATDIHGGWSNCQHLTAFPLIDFSNVRDFSIAWSACRGLLAFPLINTSKGTNFSSSWNDCRSLTTFPLVDLSQSTSCWRCFASCVNLATIPAFNLTKVVSFQYMFNGCTSLVNLPAFTMPTRASLSMPDMFDSSGISDAAYSDFLIALEAANPLNVGILDDTPAKYLPAAAAARTALLNRGWAIGDEGAA